MLQFYDTIINRAVWVREIMNIRVGFIWSVRNPKKENDQKHSKQRRERDIWGAVSTRRD